MRLEPHEIAAIAETAAQVFGPDATVRLFGSRVDDARRGGDIDLYIEVGPGQADLTHEVDFSWRLKERIGEQKIDVVLHERGRHLGPIHRIARETGTAIVRPPLAPASGRRVVAQPKLTEVLAASIAKCDAIAARLRRAKPDIGGWFPITEQRMAMLDDLSADRVEALLKRVENLQDLMSRRVFRTVLAIEAEDVTELVVRDVYNLMERRNIIESTKQWMKLAGLRHQLTHDYPVGDDDAVKRINDAYAAIDVLITTLDRVKDYVARKSLLDEAG